LPFPVASTAAESTAGSSSASFAFTRLLMRASCWVSSPALATVSVDQALRELGAELLRLPCDLRAQGLRRGGHLASTRGGEHVGPG
jgi:cysteine synthase